MKPVLLVLVAALLGGCALSKDENSLARLHTEMANKKNVPPKGFITESQLGVHFYPGCSYVDHKEFDEGGFHILEADLSTDDSADKVRDFYEKEIGAKSMPTTPPFSSIQRDIGGKHYEVGYGHLNDTTIVIKVSTPTG